MSYLLRVALGKHFIAILSKDYEEFNPVDAGASCVAQHGCCRAGHSRSGKGYREQALKLEQCLTEQFRHPKVCEQIFAQIKEAERKVYEVEVSARQTFKDKKSPPPVLNNERQGLKLQGISLSPPRLRQDPNDLYKRFGSTVIVTFGVLDKDGREIAAKPYEMGFDVYADPAMNWVFPSCEAAIAEAREKCNETALALLNFAKEMWTQIIQYKRAKGLIR